MNIEYLNQLIALNAIIPDYINNYGKVTKIFLNSGEIKEVNFSFSKVLRDYCLIHYLNVKEIKKLSADITGSKGMVPIFIRKNKILIPFKVHKKKCDEEKAFGYINIKAADRLDLDDKYVLLGSGQRIEFYDKKENIIKKIGQGQLLLERISSYQQITQFRRPINIHH